MDYQKIGLRSGIEIHQQLDTGKLFSNCPGYLTQDKPDFEIHRRLHAVAGETGEIDIAVAYEAALKKEFVYQGNNETSSLIEIDEEPPHPVNSDALDEVLKIALLLNCEIYPVAQIMRKTVIDGSNTSGFQRTVLIGHDGFVQTSFGDVPIESVALEEDSARPVERSEKKVIYRLDRLGIPLVEIATAPAMNNPEQIKECALKIGEILRACKVKRGIGTIRQDVNISIKGHDKVEIKGFQDPKMMIQTIDLEIARQQEELKKGKKEGEVRGALPDGTTEFQRPTPGRARMYPETDLPLLKISRDKLNEIRKNLPKLKAEIRDELKKKGLNEELLNLILAGGLDEFETLIKVYNKDANLVAKMVTLWRNEIATKLKQSPEKISEILNERVLETVLEAINENKITERDAKQVLESIAQGTPIGQALKVEKITDDEIEASVRALIKEKPGLRPNAYMGLIMKEFKGKIDAQKAMELINRVLSN